MTKVTSPHLSIVVVSRNDDHGGSMLERMQQFVDTLAFQCRKFDLKAELVLVETTGRRSGRRRRNVVGMHVEGDVGWVVAEQGLHAGYVRNLEADPEVRVRIRRRWRPARGRIVEDDDPGLRSS
jgi:deazaflavin-dependent oxidoreductase (nitroreductase family)